MSEKWGDLKSEYTAKGKNKSTGSKVARFMVAIPHGKGVIKCHHCNGNINAETFADFMKENLPEMFKIRNNTKGRLFLQDGILPKTVEWLKMRSILYHIDFSRYRPGHPTPIENVFHLVANKLCKNAMEKHISKETFEQFCWWIKKNLLNFSPAII